MSIIQKKCCIITEQENLNGFVAETVSITEIIVPIKIRIYKQAFTVCNVIISKLGLSSFQILTCLIFV